MSLSDDHRIDRLRLFVQPYVCPFGRLLIFHFLLIFTYLSLYQMAIICKWKLKSKDRTLFKEGIIFFNVKRNFSRTPCNRNADIYSRSFVYSV